MSRRNLQALTAGLSHSVVIRRRMPAEFQRSPIYVSSEGGLKYLVKRMGDLDPALMAFAKNHVQPGNTVWDIGANLGIFSVASAVRSGHTGRIIAIEPDTWLVEILRRTGAAQPKTSANIEVLPVAVSDALGVEQLCIARHARAVNHLRGYGHETGGTRETRAVPTVTLDWLAQHLPPPSVMKIDVEGAELAVLRGAASVLERYRPRIACEVQGEVASRVIELLHRARYDVFDDHMARVALGRTPFNVIAVPAEQMVVPVGSATTC